MRFFALLLWLALVIPARADEPVTPPASSADAFRLFAAILDQLQQHSIDPGHLEVSRHAPAAFRDLLHQLDPEIDLLTPTDLADPSPTEQQLGLTLAIRDGKVIVIAPRDGSAAQLAGLLAGDELLGVGSTLAAVRIALRTNTTIRVRDPFAIKGHDVILTPVDPSPLTNAPLKFLAPGIAYYRLAEINEAMTVALTEQLRLAAKRNTRLLILDLRNNPGGSFDSALRMARQFLPAKTIMAIHADADGNHRTTFTADGTGEFPASIPVTLLVNGGTAGAAEVFAAALQDNQRARLIGSNTFGAGRLFKQFPVANNYALWLPTARCLRPTGKDITANGLTPNIPISQTRAAERTLMIRGFAAPAVHSDPILSRAMEQNKTY